MAVIHLAYPSGHGAIVAKGIGKDKAAHAQIIDTGFCVHIIYHIIMDLLKAFPAIIIIRIDHKERTVHQSLCHQHSLSGSPWLGASRCHLIAVRKGIQLLICIFHRHHLLDPVSDHFLKILFQVFPDNEYDLIKPGFHCIMDGIIHDDLSSRSNGLQLLDSSPEPASNAGSHNDQRSLFHSFFLL